MRHFVVAVGLVCETHCGLPPVATAKRTILDSITKHAGLTITYFLLLNAFV